MLDLIPSEIVDVCIGEYLSLADFASLKTALVQRMRMNSMIFQKLASAARNRVLHKRQRCAQCCHHCITEITYNDNYRVEWVPYCAQHVSPLIMQNVDLYCVGGLSVDGVSLIV